MSLGFGLELTDKVLVQHFCYSDMTREWLVHPWIVE